MGAELSSIPGFGWARSRNLRKVEVFDVCSYNPKKGFDVLTDLNTIYEEKGHSLLDENDNFKHAEAALKAGVREAEYMELVDTGKSCGLPLKFTIMNISKSTQFRLHAHPNIELIYVKTGTIYEWRYKSDGGVKGTPLKTYSSGKDLTGPEMSTLPLSHCMFEYKACSAGQFIVNESGSIHLSYTKEDGAELVVFWSGNHANIEDLPRNHAELIELAK
jgi:hypothetical protein